MDLVQGSLGKIERAGAAAVQLTQVVGVQIRVLGEAANFEELSELVLDLDYLEGFEECLLEVKHLLEFAERLR